MKNLLIVFLPIIILFSIGMTAQAEEFVPAESEMVEENELGGGKYFRRNVLPRPTCPGRSRKPRFNRKTISRGLCT